MIEPRYIQTELRRTGITLIFSVVLTLLTIPALGLCLYGMAHGRWWPYILIASGLLLGARLGITLTQATLLIRRRLRKQQQPPSRPACTATYFGSAELLRHSSGEKNQPTK